MGLLDDVMKVATGALGAATPGAGLGGASPDAVMGLVSSLLKQQGGVGGLVANLEKAGLGDAARSWVGTGQNMPVSPDALVKALGGGQQIAQLASGLGLNGQQAGGLLATVLPMIVDQLTPAGKLPAASGAAAGPDLLQIGMKVLQGLGRKG